jgi:hypothetical protein
MLVAGLNCWVRSGYSIGTPVKQWCLTITTAGHVLIPYIWIVSTDTHLSGNLNITSVNGYIETDTWSDSSTTEMLFQTKSSGKSIGICCGTQYGPYGTNNAWIRCMGRGAGAIRCQSNTNGLNEY